MNVDVLERVRTLLELGIDLHHYMVWVDGFINRGELPLAECIVERVIDRNGRDAQARRGGAVDHELGLQSAILQVRIDVAKLGQRAERSLQDGSPGEEILQVIALKGVLVLSVPPTAADFPVFHTFQEKYGPGHLRQALPQTVD